MQVLHPHNSQTVAELLFLVFTGLLHIKVLPAFLLVAFQFPYSTEQKHSLISAGGYSSNRHVMYS